MPLFSCSASRARPVLGLALLVGCGPASAPRSPGVAEAAPCPSGTSYVPGGRFDVGEPPRTEEVPSLCFDVTEVTVASYSSCVRAGGCTPASPPEVPTAQGEFADNQLCNGDLPERQDHPVNCVRWEQARSFCAWQNKRLPSQAEWEWAARGGEEARVYPWGDAPPDPTRLNACGEECVAFGQQNSFSWKAMFSGSDGFVGTAPVGSFPAGAARFGLLDMAGNVWEWTSSAAKTPEARVDQGGGFFNQTEKMARVGTYHSWEEGAGDASLGFRCVTAPRARLASDTILLSFEGGL